MAVQVFQPFEIFYDINGRPLDDGFIWVGQPNLDPETNQISVFFDEALTIPAAQPIRTRNGFPANAGVQAQIFVSETTFSITIKNKNSTIIRSVAAVHSSSDLEGRLRDSVTVSNGSSILGRGIVAVASIAALLTQDRRTDLRYIVKGYYAGSDIGGGEFYWDAASVEADNFGTILAVTGVPTGRFKRILRDVYLHTSDFGIDLTGATSSVDRLQALVNLEIPIWLDDGDHLIDKTLFYKNTTMHGPGTLKIVSDSNFTIIADTFSSEAAICAHSPISAGPTYKLDLKCRMTFDTFTAGKPTFPIRFTRLRDSKISLDCTSTGHTAGVFTNNPDFYFDNRNTEIDGNYVLHQADPATDEGGMWVRDIGFNGADSNTHYSENVVVKSATYIFNDGVDEALAFFNPSGGTMRNCGVEAATIEGGGLGLSILEFNAANRSQSRFDCYANNTKVIVNSLRTSQAAVKFQKNVCRVYGVTAHIFGFRDTATAGQFYAGFRNAQARSDAEFPVLVDCKVVMSTMVDPASEIRGFDGALRIVEGEIAKLPGAASLDYGVTNGQQVQGGRFPGALIATFETVADVRDVLPGSVTYSNVTRRRGIGIYKTESLSPDGLGEVNLTHNFGVNPTFATAMIENNATRECMIVSRNSTNVVARIVDRATGAAITAGTFTVIWKVEA